MKNYRLFLRCHYEKLLNFYENQLTEFENVTIDDPVTYLKGYVFKNSLKLKIKNLNKKIEYYS